MVQATRAPIDEVHAAFTETRDRARHSSTVVLRCKVRWLKRHHDDFHDPVFARLCAMRHELADRGVAS